MVRYKQAVAGMAGVVLVIAVGSVGVRRVIATSGHAKVRTAAHNHAAVSPSHAVTAGDAQQWNMTAANLDSPANLRVQGIWDTAARKSTDKLTWDELKGTAKYRIYQYDTPIGTTSGTSFQVPGEMFAAGLTYYVTALDAQGRESAPSNIVTAQGAGQPGRQPRWTPPAPSAPTDLAVDPQWNNGHPRIAVSWKGNAIAATYSVYRDSKKIAQGVWDVGYMDGDVKPGGAYTYTVTGVNAAASVVRESAPSAPISAKALLAPPVPNTIGKVTITKIVSNDDSALVSFAPVPGAVDYRIFKKNRPDYPKYSGGSLSIESNGLDPDTGADLVVEAVDKLGPFQKMDGFMGPGSMNTDGSMRAAINGQGDPSNHPNVIARSEPFHVECHHRELTGKDAFYDGFHGSPPFVPVPHMDAAIVAANGGDVNSAENRYVREYRNDKWVIRNYWGDMDNTRIFLMARHFMDTVYDGGTPRTNIPVHNNNASLVMMPRGTADISGGKVLHVTFEVDAHFSGRRWIDVFVAPKDDPLIHPGKFSEAHQNPTVSGNMFRWQILFSGHEAQLYVGGVETKLLPASHDWKASRATVRNAVVHDKVVPNGTTQDLDKRHRFDLYLSKSHCRIEEHTTGGDPVSAAETDFPNGVTLPFTQAQVYFVHQVYHTGNERSGDLDWAPRETYWINHRPWADERHWDNMGFEVLPAFPGKP